MLFKANIFVLYFNIIFFSCLNVKASEYRPYPYKVAIIQSEPKDLDVVLKHFPSNCSSSTLDNTYTEVFFDVSSGGRMHIVAQMLLSRLCDEATVGTVIFSVWNKYSYLRYAEYRLVLKNIIFS